MRIFWLIWTTAEPSQTHPLLCFNATFVSLSWVQDNGAPQARRSWWGLWLPTHGTWGFQSSASPSTLAGTPSSIWGGHQDHMQLHAPAAGLLRHAPGHGAPVRTVQGDQFRGVTEEDARSQDGPGTGCLYSFLKHFILWAVPIPAWNASL